MAYTLSVYISPAGSGSVQLSPKGDYVSPGKVSYPQKTVVTLTAYPSLSLGYFDHWEGDATGTNNPVMIVVDSNKSVTAVFGTLAETVKLTTGVVGKGSVEPREGTYDIGTQITLVATPETGYVLDGWSGDIEGTKPVPDRPDALIVVMDEDRYIIATFVAIPEERWHEIGTKIRLAIGVVVPEEPEPEERWHEIGTKVRLTLAATARWSEIGTKVRLALASYTPPEEEEEEEGKPSAWGVLLVGAGAAIAAVALATEKKQKS